MSSFNNVAKDFYEAALGGTLPASPSTISGSVAVTGPLTNTQLTAVTGTASTAAWDGSAASATMIAILKSIDASLRQIAANTASS